MTRADVGRGIELEYVLDGAADAPAVVLVNGYGDQLVEWPQEFVDRLVAGGCRVLRFDNRDCGRSTHVEGDPDLIELVGGDLRSSPYDLSDMAADIVGLLDALGIERGHVVGVSMGAMIAQLAAIGHPDRVASLCSMMSCAGDPTQFAPDPEIMGELLAHSSPEDADAAADLAVLGARLAVLPQHLDEGRIRSVARVAFERDPDAAAGAHRQVAAILLATDRTEQLARLRLPTLVVHGDADRMIVLDGGRATADAVPGARLLVVPEMGHQLSAAFCEPVADAIVEHVHAAARV